MMMMSVMLMLVSRFLSLSLSLPSAVRSLCFQSYFTFIITIACQNISFFLISFYLCVHCFFLELVSSSIHHAVLSSLSSDTYKHTDIDFINLEIYEHTLQPSSISSSTDWFGASKVTMLLMLLWKRVKRVFVYVLV